MKRFVLEKSGETLAVIMAGAMLFGNPQPFLPEEVFTYSIELEEQEDFSRKLSRKKGKKDLNSSGKYVGYRRNPRDGFGRPNAPISKNNEE